MSNEGRSFIGEKFVNGRAYTAWRSDSDPKQCYIIDGTNGKEYKTREIKQVWKSNAALMEFLIAG